MTFNQSYTIIITLYYFVPECRVMCNVLFNKLRDRSMCPRITKLLHHMYTNQSCFVTWGNEHFDSFNVSNGVKQGGVISPLLFSAISFSQLEHSGLGCHVGISYTVAFSYADDIALVAPSMQCFKTKILICEK